LHASTKVPRDVLVVLKQLSIMNPKKQRFITKSIFKLMKTKGRRSMGDKFSVLSMKRMPLKKNLNFRTSKQELGMLLVF
jgi:hypothetical protein